MIFKLHYWFLAAGLNAIGLLLGVFIAEYTDADATEIGMLYMLSPFMSIVFRPLICSLADREQAHQKYLILCSNILSFTYLPFVIIPLLGPQVYDVHPRLCFYTLVAFKVVGDAALGGVVSIGDSLAINYAKRIGVNFSVYRVWGTISWMVFGVITGQVNEIKYLPKYVPGFLVLILSSLINSLLYYVWPKEYFRMVIRPDKPEIEDPSKDNEKDPKKKKKKVRVMFKSLMPRDVVWTHAKRQLWLLATFRCWSSPKTSSNEDGKDKNDKRIASDENCKEQAQKPVDRATQMQILKLLMRRDPRIILYALVFVCGGFTVVPLSYLFINVAVICNEGNRCNFSQLAGLLQLSMALAETFLFLYIKRIMAKIGRINTVSISFFLTAAKFTFYATIWEDVDPYFAVLIELAHGVIFGIYLTLCVEMGHLFSKEVEHVIPELIEKGIVPEDADKENLEVSLKATMQAILSIANDGFGRGFGALIYGLILDHYTFATLWRCIAIGAAIVFAIIQVTNILDSRCRFNLGANLTRLPSPSSKTIEDGASRQDTQNPKRADKNEEQVVGAAVA